MIINAEEFHETLNRNESKAHTNEILAYQKYKAARGMFEAQPKDKSSVIDTDGMIVELEAVIALLQESVAYFRLQRQNKKVVDVLSRLIIRKKQSDD